MTPRLKILLILFGLSLLVLAGDRLFTDTNSNPKQTIRVPNKVKNTSKNTPNSFSDSESLNTSPFIPISAQILSLTGWGRNPFVKKLTKAPNQSPALTESKKGVSVRLAELNNLVIESVYKIGNDAVVVIDGKPYRKGEMLNNMLIEKIDEKKIVFKFRGKSYDVHIGS